MFAHIDADAFFASVLQRKDPRLQGKPLLALGAGGGVVIAASYPAKAKGVRTGMLRKEAQKLCPEAVAIPSDFTEASRASKQIESILASIALTEQASIDEWYLDVGSLSGGVPEDLKKWAKDLQERISQTVAIGVSIGIAETKLLAKMAGEYRKPSGVFIVGKDLGDIENFLRDRPIAAIPGIGRARQAHAASLNWRTAWDFVCAPTETIVHLFGKPGMDLKEELKGHPMSRVSEERAPPKSISRCRSFRATHDRAIAFAFLLQHLTATTIRLREAGLACQTAQVWGRDRDLRYAGEHARLPQPFTTEEQILPYLRRCFDPVWSVCSAGCTQIGICLSDLLPAGNPQYSLFENPGSLDRTERVQRTLDSVRSRFGRDSVMRGANLTLKPRRLREDGPNAYGSIQTVN